MKHPTAEQLSAFHDGIAGARTLVAIEEHVSECAECHDVLASLDRQDPALSAMLTPAPGAAHFDALAARIERRDRPRGQGPLQGPDAERDRAARVPAAAERALRRRSDEAAAPLVARLPGEAHGFG